MVSSSDRAYFRRIADTLAREEVSSPPTDLDGVLAVVARLCPSYLSTRLEERWEDLRRGR